MAFPGRIKKRAAPRRKRGLDRVLIGPLGHALHMVFVAATVALVLAGMVYLRLTQGPIHVPMVARVAANLFNESSDRVKVSASDFIVTLGEQGRPAGLQFLNVRVSNPEGALLFVVPRLSAHFDLADLVLGRLRPTRVAVIGPEARFLLTRDGQLRFGLGKDFEALTGGAGNPEAAALQFAAVERVIGGFVGDVAPAPELSRLSRIDILDADLTFENEAVGRVWRTKRADIQVSRIPDGARVRLAVNLAENNANHRPDNRPVGADLVVVAERHKGAGATQVTGQFDRLRPEYIAEQLSQLEWLKLFDAPVSGRMAGTVEDGGKVTALSGELDVGPGQVLALGDKGRPIEHAVLDFAYEPGLQRMHFTDFELVSKALDAKLSGFADLTRDASGAVSGLAGQLAIDRIQLDLPSVFADPLEFDGGQIVARMSLDPMKIDVAEAHVRRKNLVLDVTGSAEQQDGVWHTDLRASGRNVSLDGLLAHWPVTASPGTRKWITENIRRARIGQVVAQMRFVGREPQLALDFSYSGLDTTYLGDMTPILNAKGQGSLTLHSFVLSVASGEVEPVKGQPVSLAGSTFRVPDLGADPAMGQVDLQAKGPSASILKLIDEKPLHLTRRLGLDPASVRGAAQVSAQVEVPLVQNVTLDEVHVTSKATLDDLRMPFTLPNGKTVSVASKSVELDATKEGMHLAGAAALDGAPVSIDWNEYYGRGRNHRVMTFDGTATPALLGKLNVGDRNFSGGSAEVKVKLEQTGSPDYAIDVKADLTKARLDIPELGWVKKPGAPGRLEAHGTLRHGNGIAAKSFTLDTDALKVSGAVAFGEAGDLQTAQIARARYLGLADVGAKIRRGPKGAYLVDMTGRRLDLGILKTLPTGDAGAADSKAEAPAPEAPVDVTFKLDQLAITPKVVAEPASGTFTRNAADGQKAHLEGKVAGAVPFTASYSRKGKAPGRMTLTSDDAGGLLNAAGMFAGARGGRLVLNAVLAPSPGTDLTGLAKIKDVRVKGTGTFTTILDKGGVKDAAKAAQKGGGLHFDSVRVPFDYGGGKLLLDDATAKGALLAVKAQGEVNEGSGKLDLVGVISPAYALTGLLNNIPLLGTILSGGKDEGITAMTFSVKGTIEKPDFHVNPLTLLAPGILRKVFSGRTKLPNERFMKQLEHDSTN